MKIISLSTNIVNGSIYMHGIGDDGELYQLVEDVTMERGVYKYWRKVPVHGNEPVVVEVENGNR